MQLDYIVSFIIVPLFISALANVISEWLIRKFYDKDDK